MKSTKNLKEKRHVSDGKSVIGGKKSAGKKTPPTIHIVWADNINEDDLKGLLGQVKSAFSDPECSIIANYEIHWDVVRVKKSAFHSVWADDLNNKELEELKEHVKKALYACRREKKDYIIVVNYEVHWNVIKK